ncbi:MAG: AAA family ATPase [Salinarimonas sp.]
MHTHILLTGAMGAGKSTLARLLEARGLAVVHEPARQILAEQRRFGGAGVPATDPRLFVELMLSRALHFHGLHREAPGPVLFDRGVPDMIAYAELFGLDTAPYRRAAQAYRYAPQAFVAPDWPEIYATDDERRMSYEEARAFGARLRAIYAELGYALVELPRATPEARADVVAAHLAG